MHQWQKRLEYWQNDYGAQLATGKTLEQRQTPSPTFTIGLTNKQNKSNSIIWYWTKMTYSSLQEGSIHFVLLRCMHLATTLMIEREYLRAFNVINLQATRPAYNCRNVNNLLYFTGRSYDGYRHSKLAVLSPSGICPWHSSVRWTGEGIVHAVASKHWRWTELTKYAT